ncbi:MAG TPA: SHOCT domain-containing protein [Mycobacterium sp.]|nr:SHOCT domain-containing protein [Mycobacterium sp.]
MKLKRLSDRELFMNQQAAMITASVLSQPVEAATRCEQISTKATKMYAAGGGDMRWKSVPNGTGLPKSFILAVTRTHVYALEDKQHRGQLVPGLVLKAWDRTGFRVQPGRDAMLAAAGMPDDRQSLILFLPIDADSGPMAQQIAHQREAAGQRTPGLPHGFVVGRDAASQRVVAALVASSPAVGGITINGQTIQQMAPPPSTTAQRLQELETLRATGVITDDEYARKRAQIISEI